MMDYITPDKWQDKTAVLPVESEQSDLRIESYFSLANTGYQTELEINDASETDSADDCDYTDPDILPEPLMSFNLRYPFTQWKKHMTPCFTVLERLSKDEIREYSLTGSVAKCSHHCRKRHLDNLCNLGLLTCDNHPDILLQSVKKQKIDLPCKRRIGPKSKKWKLLKNCLLEGSLHVQTPSSIIVCESPEKASLVTEKNLLCEETPEIDANLIGYDENVDEGESSYLSFPAPLSAELRENIDESKSLHLTPLAMSENVDSNKLNDKNINIDDITNTVTTHHPVIYLKTDKKMTKEKEDNKQMKTNENASLEHHIKKDNNKSVTNVTVRKQEKASNLITGSTDQPLKESQNEIDVNESNQPNKNKPKQHKKRKKLKFVHYKKRGKQDKANNALAKPTPQPDESQERKETSGLLDPTNIIPPKRQYHNFPKNRKKRFLLPKRKVSRKGNLENPKLSTTVNPKPQLLEGSQNKNKTDTCEYPNKASQGSIVIKRRKKHCYSSSAKKNKQREQYKLKRSLINSTPMVEGSPVSQCFPTSEPNIVENPIQETSNIEATSHPIEQPLNEVNQDEKLPKLKAYRRKEVISRGTKSRPKAAKLLYSEKGDDDDDDDDSFVHDQSPATATSAADNSSVSHYESASFLGKMNILKSQIEEKRRNMATEKRVGSQDITMSSLAKWSEQHSILISELTNNKNPITKNKYFKTLKADRNLNKKFKTSKTNNSEPKTPQPEESQEKKETSGLLDPNIIPPKRRHHNYPKNRKNRKKTFLKTILPNVQPSPASSCIANMNLTNKLNTSKNNQSKTLQSVPKEKRAVTFSKLSSPLPGASFSLLQNIMTETNMQQNQVQPGQNQISKPNLFKPDLVKMKPNYEHNKIAQVGQIDQDKTRQAYPNNPLKNSQNNQCQSGQIKPSVSGQHEDRLVGEMKPPKEGSATPTLSPAAIQKALASLKLHLAKQGKNFDANKKNGVFLLQIEGNPVLIKMADASGSAKPATTQFAVLKKDMLCSPASQPGVLFDKNSTPLSNLSTPLNKTIIPPSKTSISTSKSKVPASAYSSLPAPIAPKTSLTSLLESIIPNSPVVLPSKCKTQSLTPKPALSSQTELFPQCETHSVTRTSLSSVQPSTTGSGIGTDSSQVNSNSYIRQILNNNKVIIHKPTESNECGSKNFVFTGPNGDDIRMSFSTDRTLLQTKTAKLPTGTNVSISNSESRTTVSIYNAQETLPEPASVSLIKSLSRVPLCSSLLPQRQLIARKPETERERLVRRKLLETKYPLPPGVIIKSEPDDDDVELSGYQVESEVLLVPQQPVNSSSNGHMGFESWAPPEDNDNASLFYESYQPEPLDEPPLLVQQSSSSESLAVDKTEISCDEEMPPVLQLENYDDLHNSPTTSSDGASYSSHSPLPSSGKEPEQTVSSSSVDSDTTMSGSRQTDSGIDSGEPSAESSLTSVAKSPVIPRIKPTYQNPKIQHLKELLEKKRKEIERIRQMSQEESSFD